MKYDSIAPDVKYIGVDDLDIDLFEGQYEGRWVFPTTPI